MRRFPSPFGLLLLLTLSACGGGPRHDLGQRAAL
jgi:hypothetical protein